MLSIEEARARQRRAEKRTIIVFLVSLVVAAAATAALFTLTGWLSKSFVFWLIPAALTLLIVYKSNIGTFLQPKEFRGEISDIYVFCSRDQVVKGAAWGHGPNVTKAYLASRFTIADKQKGKSIERSYRNNEVISNLSIGDELVILRFVDEPVILSKIKFNKQR